MSDHRRQLLSKIADRSARVGVIGLGYVGLPLALLFEESGFPVTGLDVDPAHKLANHQLLASLLRNRAEVLEVPVRFFPISPKRVKRTSLLDGGRAMVEILMRRLRSPENSQ